LPVLEENETLAFAIPVQRGEPMTDFRSLTLKQLRALSGTIEHGSVTNAARALGVTPPAVTMHLKQLEQLVGAPLFDRSVEGFEPTAIGKAMLKLAIDADRVIAQAVESIDALRAGATGTVVFAAVSTAKYMAPGLVARFRLAHPGLRVKLVVGNRGDIVAGVERSEFDLAIMGYPPSHLPLVNERFGDNPHIAVAAPDHPLAKADSIKSDDLLVETFLAREMGSGTRRLLERFLDRIGNGRPLDVVEMGTNETIKQAVMAGLGLAVLSAHTCQSELDEGKLVSLKIEGLPIVRQWFLVHRADRTPSAASELFREFLLANRKLLLPATRTLDKP
jgi:DNA-binding transcriptional LysR family regulator